MTAENPHIDTLRQRVEMLLARLYRPDDQPIPPDLLAELQQARQELARLEESGPEAGWKLLELRAPRLEDAGAGEFLDETPSGVDVTVIKRMSHVPLGFVHLLESRQNPLISCHITNPEDNGRRVWLRVSSYVEQYSAQCVDTVEVKAGETLTIDQLPAFFPERARAISELTRATLHVQVDNLTGGTEQHRTFPVWLLARTTAFNGIYDPDKDEWVDMSRYLAAWVTPDAPEVLALLRAAAGFHPQHAFSGYLENAQGVEEQVRAIYAALRAEQICYINSVICFGDHKRTRMQRARLPREALANRSANCLDGTLLVASLLEAASLNPAIVLVPRHALLAWEIQPGTDEWDYLETTMLSTCDFDAARDKGRRLAELARAEYQTSKDPRDFNLLSIRALRRKDGITPME